MEIRIRISKKRKRQEEVEPVKIPRPMRSRVESKSSNKLLKATHSTIQMAAIPLVLQHRDVIGVAETGSGKAAAFISRKPKMRRFAYGLIEFLVQMQSLVNFFPDNIGRLLVAFPAVFTFYIVFLIFLVAARDPGIIPRTQPSSDVDDDWDATSLSSDWAQSDAHIAPFAITVLIALIIIAHGLDSVSVSSKYSGYAFSLNFSKKIYETESSDEGSDLYLERCETNPANHSSKWAVAPDLHRFAIKYANRKCIKR
ncbi:probable protein S-acyltransferase 7 [Tanacetum coccineum]